MHWALFLLLLGATHSVPHSSMAISVQSMIKALQSFRGILSSVIYLEKCPIVWVFWNYNVFFSVWCWRWNSNTLATWCEELTHLKRHWCWARLRAGGEGDDRGWNGWMASLTQWTWVWVNSGSWWWTGRPGVLQSMGLQRVGHDWATELNWTEDDVIEHRFGKKYVTGSCKSVPPYCWLKKLGCFPVSCPLLTSSPKIWC